MFCPNCRTENESRFRYCYSCGFTLPVIPHEEVEMAPEEEPIPATEIITEEPIKTNEDLLRILKSGNYKLIRNHNHQ